MEFLFAAGRSFLMRREYNESVWSVTAFPPAAIAARRQVTPQMSPSR